MPSIARMTLFMMLAHVALGAIMPYLPVWLATTKGLTGAQIGVILASSSFGRILVGPLVAAWAEGRGDRRIPLIVFSSALALGYLSFPFLGAFWPIALACFATGVMFQCLMPFAEAGVMRVTSNSRRWPYGRARAAASAAFVLANLGAGATIQAFNVEAVYAWFIIASLATMACGFWLHPEPIAQPAATPLGTRLLDGFALFKSRTFFLAVLAASFIQAAHAFYYGFSSQLWLKQGFSGSQVGMLWAFGVIVEIAFFALLASRLNHFRPETLILWGGIASIIRWAAFAQTPDLGVTFMVQALHALTFAATHMGFMRLIDAEIPLAQRATGQQLGSALIMSPTMGLASIAAGTLYDQFSSGGYWSGVILATVGLILISLLLSPRQPTLKLPPEDQVR
ncbi:MFS transporter [Aquidulcibacter sp.]|uniref:MFS transporter n=1 Tax=Aquidulcibacter sp. TaxID=2052990 RepID=UPI003783811C